MAEEREYEIGEDEAWKANLKNLFDAWLNETIEGSRFSRNHIGKILADAQQDTVTKQNISNQALQNAVETANMLGKQTLRHFEIGTDRQWNVDEVSGLTAKTGLQQDTIAGIVTAVVSEVLSKLPKT